MKCITKTMELAGSSYEIGKKIGEMAAAAPMLKQVLTSGFKGFDDEAVKEARELFSRWCPGLNEELEGFAEALDVSPAQVVYYAQTSLRPNCSQIGVLPSMTEEGEPLLARNYEFNPEMEDFTLMRTSVTGKYTHLATSVLQFGREDGFNECGLAVTMSSCGFPVGANEFMRRPKLKGLQYWAVIRSILENCKDVEETLLFLKEMPIAYNLNMILMDRTGCMALVETLDGRMAVKQIPDENGTWYLCATNHQVIPELVSCEPVAMRHSLTRYNWIRETMDKAGKVNRETLKQMLLSMYPNGLCCHFYKDFFGTTKSMVISPASGTVEICWGGEVTNGWNIYRIDTPLLNSFREIEVNNIPFPRELGEFLPLEVES